MSKNINMLFRTVTSQLYSLYLKEKTKQKKQAKQPYPAQVNTIIAQDFF